MGKSSPSAPPAPDPVATASAQGQANTSSAAAQAALNYVNQNTPYGSTAYDQTGSYTDPNGQTVPTYTQTTNLSPLGQQILSGEQGVATSLIPATQSLANQASWIAQNQPLTFNSPFSGVLNQGPQQLDTNAANAIYGQQKSFLDPQWNQQQKQLEDQLSRQGIPVGSEAYTNAMTQLDNARTQAYQSAQDAATAGGASSASQLFGMAQAGQNQFIQQQQLAQQQPLSLLSEMYGATPASPTQPIATPSATGVSPTDVTGAAGLSANSAMQRYQAQLAQQNATYGGLASLAGTGAMAAALAFSDGRLKRDIEYFTTTNGHKIYRFRYEWGPEKFLGVLAQEINETRPDAVYEIGGYLAVDYNALGLRLVPIDVVID